MATTVITLTVSPVASRNVLPVATNLGNMIVSTNDITEVDRHSGRAGVRGCPAQSLSLEGPAIAPLRRTTWMSPSCVSRIDLYRGFRR